MVGVSSTSDAALDFSDLAFEVDYATRTAHEGTVHAYVAIPENVFAGETPADPYLHDHLQWARRYADEWDLIVPGYGVVDSARWSDEDAGDTDGLTEYDSPAGWGAQVYARIRSQVTRAGRVPWANDVVFLGMPVAVAPIRDELRDLDPTLWFPFEHMGPGEVDAWVTDQLDTHAWLDDVDPSTAVEVYLPGATRPYHLVYHESGIGLVAWSAIDDTHHGILARGDSVPDAFEQFVEDLLLDGVAKTVPRSEAPSPSGPWLRPGSSTSPTLSAGTPSADERDQDDADDTAAETSTDGQATLGSFGGGEA